MTAPQGNDQRNANVVLTADTSQYQQQMQNSTQSTNRLGAAIDSLAGHLDGLTKRAGRKLIQFSAGDFAALAGATATAANFEKQLATLNATAKVSGANFGELKNGIEKAFTSLPVSRTQIIQLTEAMTNMGYTNSKTINELVLNFSKLGAATGENAGELAAGLTQLSRLMGANTAQQIGNFSNALLMVSKQAGVSATGVLQFSQAIAPLARQAGISEAAVLGISTAFSKAGADGYVAANTFNTLVSDITNMVQTGSPQLEKYANLIGVTQRQFAHMDKTTALTDIFEAISNQGPRAIQTLNQLGIDGVRAQSAIAAVVQSGDLRQNIRSAVAGSNDQRTLNSASKTAMSGLSDDLVKLRNNFTEFATEIGTSFLPPLEKVVSIFNKLFTFMNAAIRPFAPLISAVGALAGALTSVGGLALIAFAAISKLSLIGGAVRPLLAFRGGLAAGRNPEESNAWAERNATNNLGMFSRRTFALGAGMGSVAASRAATEGESTIGAARGYLSRAAMFGATAPLRAATWVNNGTADSMQQFRTGNVPGGGLSAVPIIRAQQLLRGGVSGGGTEEETARAAHGASTELAGTARAARESATRMGESAAASAEATAATRTLGSEAGRLSRSFLRVGAETVATGAAAVGRGAAAFGKASWQTLGPIGALAIGLPLAFMGIGAMRHKSEQQADYTDSLNPIIKYNEQLGIANTNLADFSNQLTAASKNLADKQTPVTFASAGTVSTADLNNIPKKVTDQNIGALAKYAPKNAGALRTYAQSLDITDPRQLQALKQQALAAGYDQPTINKALGGLTQASTAGGGAVSDYTTLAGLAFNAEGNGAFANNPSSAGKSLIGSALSGIGSTYQVNRVRYGNNYAAGQQLNSTVGFLSSYLGNLSGTNSNRSDLAIKQISNALSATRGGDSDDYEAALRKAFTTTTVSRAGTFTRYNSLDPQARQQAILQVLGATQQGRDFLSSSPTTNLTQLQSLLPHLQASTVTPFQRTLQGFGALGRYVQDTPLLQRTTGTGTEIGNPAQQAQAQEDLLTQSTKLSGGFAGAALALQKMADAAEQADPALSALAAAASSQARDQYQSTVLPTLSRAGQTQYAQTNLNQARAQFEKTGSQTDRANYDQARSQNNQQLEANRQYMLSIYTTVRDYTTQIERSYEDYHKQVYRTERDFQIQMEHSERDYLRSRYRQQRDFNIQMQQQALQSAQSIYNPFTRVFAQQTADAGTTLQNLRDQNERIQAQYGELQRLRQMGVSQQTIDVLNLADPSNAQQLQNLVQGITNNPAMVKAINAAVNQRQKATTQLTQSDFNVTFRQTVDAFHRSFRDMAQDFQTSREDALQAEQRGLSDMSTDFKQMVDRSQEDLQTSMTEIYGSFQDLEAKTFAQLGKYIAKEAPQFAKTIQKAINGITPPDFSNSDGSTSGGGGATIGKSGSATNPITRPNVTGVNSQGELGHYGPGGKWYSATPVQRRLYQGNTPPHVASPSANANTPQGAQHYAASILGNYGWNQGQMSSLISLWNGESGWRYSALNSSSGAYGIPQSLPADKMASAGADWHSNGATQIRWGLSYIKGRYGTPTNAYQQWLARSPHWYDNGGVLQPGVTQTINATGKPEFILTPKQLKAFHTMGMGTQATNNYHKVFMDNSTNFNGEITVVAQDPNMMIKQLAARARVARLSHPPRSTAGLAS